ncbi:MAG: tetratricopeptide repeat protein [Acidobacteria bacterium]|nr:tetratricopeptide repeat protein [Acidobacteriota bacterium]
MTCNPRVQSPRLISGLFVFLVVSTFQAPGWQEKISPVSDYQYKKDYAQFETIRKEADPQKRADLLLGFMKEHPISRMLTYVVADYLECVKPHMQSKNWAKVISMEEAMLALMPSEKTVRAAAVPEPGAGDFLKNVLPAAERSIQQALLAAYYQSGNMPKAAEMGERMYAASPDAGMAAALADIYLKMNNAGKFTTYAEKAVSAIPIEHSYTLALQLAGIYQQNNDLPRASGYAEKVMAVYGDKVPQGFQESAWNTSRAYCYGLMGLNAYANKDYDKTLEHYTKVLKLAPKSDDAWYYTGMVRWRREDPEGAIDAFAKCVVINKTMAKRAQENLEKLYKARHNDTLDGLDQVLAKAKSELGIS